MEDPKENPEQPVEGQMFSDSKSPYANPKDWQEGFESQHKAFQFAEELARGDQLADVGRDAGNADSIEDAANTIRSASQRPDDAPLGKTYTESFQRENGRHSYTESREAREIMLGKSSDKLDLEASVESQGGPVASHIITMSPDLSQQKEKQPDTALSATSGGSGENGGDKTGNLMRETGMPQADRSKAAQEYAQEQGRPAAIDAEELRSRDIQMLDNAHGQPSPDASKEVGHEVAIRSDVPEQAVQEQGRPAAIDAEELRSRDMQMLENAHGQPSPDASNEVGHEATIRSDLPER